MADLITDLHRAMNSRGVRDKEIRRGARLSEQVWAALATRLGLEEAEVKLLAGSLARRLTEEADLAASLREDLGAPRFSFEPDAIGNVTVRDGATGKSIFLRGSAASALLNRLKRTPREGQQKILATYEPNMTEASRIGGGRDSDEFEYDGDLDDSEHHSPNDINHNDALKRTGFWGSQGAGCIAIAADTGRMLLMHRAHWVQQPHTWGNCGGAIDSGEDPKEAALRELGEEAGYWEEALKIIPLLVFQKGSFKYFNFLVIVEQEFEPTLNSESQDADWFEFGDWPSPLHFGVAAVLKDPASVKAIQAVIAAKTTQTDESVLGEAVEATVVLDEEEDFNEEIEQTGGFYNFPWTVGTKHGTGSARWKGRGPQMQITVRSVRDAVGKTIEPDAKLAEAIHQQAVDFIGDE